MAAVLCLGLAGCGITHPLPAESLDGKQSEELTRLGSKGTVLYQLKRGPIDTADAVTAFRDTLLMHRSGMPDRAIPYSEVQTLLFRNRTVGFIEGFFMGMVVGGAAGTALGVTLTKDQSNEGGPTVAQQTRVIAIPAGILFGIGGGLLGMMSGVQDIHDKDFAPATPAPGPAKTGR